MYVKYVKTKHLPNSEHLVQYYISTMRMAVRKGNYLMKLIVNSL